MAKNALEEAFIQKYFDNERLIRFSQANLMVTAIMTGARQIAAAIVGDTTSNSQNITNHLQSLKGLLFPEFTEETKKSADKAKSIMEKVDKLGPIKVAPVGDKKSGGRVKRGNR